MRICRIRGGQNLGGKLFCIVFRTIAQEGRFVIVDCDTVIVGHAIDHRKASDWCGDCLLNQMDQIVIGQPRAERARIVDLCGGKNAQVHAFNTLFVPIEASKVFSKHFAKP